MKTKILWLFAFLSICLSGPGRAEPLRIETILGPPWGFVDSDGRASGMMYEIGNRIAEVAGLQYTNTLVPYPRTAVDLENGIADVVLRFGNEHLARVAVPVGVVVSMPIVVVGPQGTNYKHLSELQGKTVGMVRTSNYIAQFDTNSSINKYAVNDYVTMAKMLSMRRLDAGIGSSLGFFYGAYLAGVKKEELGQPLVLGSNDFILFLAKRSAKPETIRALKEAIQKLTASGEIKAIMSKYSKAVGGDSR